MKHIPLGSGPFRKWLFFQQDEIEKIATDDLRVQGLLPQRPEPVNIDRLVTKLFSLDPIYEDAGDGVLGFIRFGSSKPEKIILHASLGEIGDATTEHRRRSTLAHECGHGRLHVVPFTELVQAKRAGHGTEWVRDATHRAQFLCRSGDVREGEGAKPPPPSGVAAWERMAEWQANRYMAAVLAPARLVRLAVGEELGLREAHVEIRLEAARRDALAPLIARQFNVSRQLAACRLSELFPAADAQALLFAA
jgi:nitrite reductase/ring-hydroxylating ferredoxin subunit